MTTNKSNKEEERRMFFDMQEHPERYTDEQVEALLADEDIKTFFHDMAMARMAQQKSKNKSVNVDEEWKKFAASHGLASDKVVSHAFGNRFKVAASIIGVVLLSGVAFAAIKSGMFRSSSSKETSLVKAEQTSSVTNNNVRQDGKTSNAKETADSLDLKPVVFDNAELGYVVSQLAAFYHVKVEFADAASQHVRVFFNWDKTKTLQQNLDILNAFERIQITYSPDDETLKVE